MDPIQTQQGPVQPAAPLQAAPSAPMPVAESAPHKRGGHIVLFIIIFILGIVLGGFLGYLWRGMKIDESLIYDQAALESAAAEAHSRVLSEIEAEKSAALKSAIGEVLSVEATSIRIRFSREGIGEDLLLLTDENTKFSSFDNSTDIPTPVEITAADIVVGDTVTANFNESVEQNLELYAYEIIKI
ncbi:MAG: hypothetical protein R3B52_00505 [Candidatus Paceibacterota bacterium]